MVYAVCAILAGVFEARLPLGIAPTTKLPPAGIPHPIGAHALILNKILAHRCGSSFGQMAIALRRAARIGVAFDHEIEIRKSIRVQRTAYDIELSFRARGKHRRVRLEGDQQRGFGRFRRGCIRD